LNVFKVGEYLTLLINYRYYTHIIATHIDAEGVRFFGGDVDLGFASNIY
jgi:hypothetical protein